ncbi:MAG: HAD hydrolase family protein [Muribaculaceae bacterium]|nr:HAD hydrolase family protein [Muribaculaceae bacterium]
MSTVEPVRTLYVSDLDGTLLGADSRVSPTSCVMLNEAIEQGALFTVATARTPATVAPLLADVSMRLPAIVMTGTATWCRDTRAYSDVHSLTTRDADRIIALCDRMGLPVFVYTLRDNVLHVYHTGPLTDAERAFMAERLHTPFKCFHVPSSGISMPPYTLGEVLLLFALRPTDQVAPVYEQLRYDNGCNPVFYHEKAGSDTALMEVFAPGVSKAGAIHDVARQCGATRIVAFGDNINDIPMLKAADVAVAVANAMPEVIEVADVVIGPNTADSVPRFILDDMAKF